jgi:hypothetical protein
MKPGLIFPIILFQRSQPGTEDLARIGILAAMDLRVDKLVHLRREIDIARRHKRLLVYIKKVGNSWQESFLQGHGEWMLFDIMMF